MRPATGHIAIIPARGGSKRLPDKNILPLGDQPLINWSIDAARQSGVFSRIIVSTDCTRTADIAIRAGAEVPELRPAELASDTTPSTDVIAHVLSNLTLPAGAAFCLLQPTSPLRQGAHIRESLQLMLDQAADNVVSVCPCEHSPLWSNTLPPSGALSGFIRPEARDRRSQDLPVYYRINGAIYWVDIKRFKETHQCLLEENSYAYIMSHEASADIDHQIDLDYCQLIVNRKHVT